jgi:uncharacterized membrane protein YraQ (UPF0718 family)
MIKKLEKIPGALKFLSAMVIVYIVAGFFNFEYILSASGNLAKNTIEIIPILLLAYIAVFLINLFVSPERIKRHLGHDSGFRGWIYASLGSILFSGPPYVILPILGELKNHGMRYSFITVSLNNRNVQPAFLPVMIYYFGLPFTAIISVYILIFAILSGMIMGKLMSR